MATDTSDTQRPRERQTERVVFYITPSFRERLTAAISVSGMAQADWCRRVIESAVERTGRSSQSDTAESLQSDNPEVREISKLTADLAAARATIEGQERLIQQQRERQGMSDSLNQELSQRLEVALGTIDRVTLALPASGDSSASRGFNWRFWQR